MPWNSTLMALVGIMALRIWSQKVTVCRIGHIWSQFVTLVTSCIRIELSDLSCPCCHASLASKYLHELNETDG